MIVKIHQGPHGKVLVISDSELVGKKFEEGKLQLDLTKDFYKGKEMNIEEIKELAKSCYIFHLTGSKSVEMFSDQIDKKMVVQGIPHAEIYSAEN